MAMGDALADGRARRGASVWRAARIGPRRRRAGGSVPPSGRHRVFAGGEVAAAFAGAETSGTVIRGHVPSLRVDRREAPPHA